MLRTTRTRRVTVSVLLAGTLLLTACGGQGAATPGSSPAASSPAASSPAASSPAASPSTGAGAAAAAGRFQDPTAESAASATTAIPTRVLIPAIGVDAPMEVLSVDADNALQPPVAWEAGGWYDRSPLPGERGPSVIAGHLTAPDGPAVFVDLGLLRPGDQVTVEQSDGSSATFAVDRSISAERTDSFPTEEIYGPTPDAQLRLITCDGEYDPARGHWTRNMVVFATEVPS